MAVTVSLLLGIQHRLSKIVYEMLFVLVLAPNPCLVHIVTKVPSILYALSDSPDRLLSFWIIPIPCFKAIRKTTPES